MWAAWSVLFNFPSENCRGNLLLAKTFEKTSFDYYSMQV